MMQQKLVELIKEEKNYINSKILICVNCGNDNVVRGIEGISCNDCNVCIYFRSDE